VGRCLDGVRDDALQPRPLWSGLFCGGCGLGRNLRVAVSNASFEEVYSPASTFFTAARDKP
jgi:hypothetical protein